MMRRRFPKRYVTAVVNAIIATALGALISIPGAGARVSALDVAITSGPSGVVTATDAAFEFTANARDATFTCSLDGSAAQRCTSPAHYRGLSVGRHRFVVVARNGRESAVASRIWEIESTPPPPTPPPSPPGPAPGPGPAPAPAPGCGIPGKIVICFDDLPVATEVTSQYLALGVRFGVTPTDALGKSGVFPLIASDFGAHSGTQIARTPACGKEFCFNTVYGKFASPHSFVSVRAGGGATVKLTAFTAGGAVVASVVKPTGTAVTTNLQISSLVKNIVFFQIEENAPGGAQMAVLKLDDLAFDAPAGRAVPDFSLVWQPSGFSDSVGVSKGGSAATTVYITRISGSYGAISFKVDPSSVPAGVSATVEPATAHSWNSAVTVKLKAGTYAATAVNVKLKVIGHPDSATAGPADRSVQIPVTIVLSDYDLEATGIEVNQGIQKQMMPYYAGGALSSGYCSVMASLPYGDLDVANDAVPYQTFEQVVGPYGLPTQEGTSVELVAGRRTVVRAFARVASPTGAKIGGVPALLYGKRNGNALPGSPLSPDDGVHDVVWRALDWVTCLDRADPKRPYTFTLPASWTDGTITLRAKLTPDNDLFSPGNECGSVACAANNEFTLTGVKFAQPPTVTVTPVAMKYSGAGGAKFAPPAPGKVLDAAFYLTPGVLSYDGASDFGYAGVIGITDETSDPDLQDDRGEMCSALLDRLEDWADEHSHGDATLGVFNSDSAVCPGVSDGDYSVEDDGESYAVAAANRRFTSIAHELFHGYGRPHAGNDPACYPEEEQLGIEWLPDNRGHIHGIGMDTRSGSGGGNGPYDILVPGALLPLDPYAQSQPTEWFDFMSYCGGESNSWISSRGWASTLADLRDAPAVARTLAADEQPSLRVTAVASHGAVRITRVKPRQRPGLRGAASPYRLVGKNAVGAVVSENAMTSSSTVVHGRAPVLLLRGDIHAKDVVAVEIVGGTAIVARRARSPESPRVAVVHPRRGAVIGKTRNVRVEWRTSDPDGPAGSVKVDYSTNGGRTWETVATGLAGTGERLPRALFAGSRTARIRVRVSDGFNEASAVSARFRVLGLPPAVRIVSPRGGRIRGDAVLFLEGRASDDRGKSIPPRMLRWYLDKKFVATGRVGSVIRPAPGTHTLRLVARDGRGRVGSANARVRVVAAEPAFLVLRAPAVLTRTATALTLRVATTLPAVLRIEGRDYTTGRATRAITIPVARRRDTLRLHLRLSANGKVSRTVLVVARR